MTAVKAPAVYAAIAAVMKEMAKEGISKDRRNQQQGYNFRGIDDVYNALGKVLAENSLVMLPRVVEQAREERKTAKGGLLLYTILTVEFDLVAAVDGSMHMVRTVGEAMDSADKSSNKAQSAAMKYAALQVFMIPTEGDNDADATTHDVQARGDQAPKAISQAQWAKIVQLIEATGTNTDKMLKHYRVDDLKKMTDPMARDCINILEDTLAAKARKETQKSLADELGDDLGGFDK